MGAGSAATILDTSIRGAIGADALISWRSLSSSRQSAQLSTCAVIVALSMSFSRPFIRSGSASRISAFMQSVTQELLHCAHCVVIMNSRGALSRSDDVRDLLVRQSLFNPQKKDFVLRGRQTRHRFS